MDGANTFSEREREHYNMCEGGGWMGGWMFGWLVVMLANSLFTTS